MSINNLFCSSNIKLRLINIFLIIFLLDNALGNSTIYQSQVKLVVQGKGNIFFLSESFYLEPSEVIVNGISKDSHQKNCTFEYDLNNITIKFDELINSCEKLFYGLKNIIEIDLSKLDTSEVTNMSSMFDGCSNLEKVNFGNINTSLVKNMEYLFHNCSKLSSIDVSKFDTSSVTSFKYLFRYCISLTSIDVSNFNTQNVVNIHDIFSYCHNLTSVDLSNFDTSKVINMRGLFYQCYNLKHLDLSNFDTSLVTNFNGIFSFDNALVYINLYSFKIKNGSDIGSILSYTSSNLKICINDEDTQNVLKSTGKKFNCSDICFKDNIKIDLKTNKCIEYCNDSEYKYEYDNYCYDTCPNTTFLKTNNEYLCLDKTKGDNYYYDKDKKVFRECYNTCKTCNKEGNKTNNNCIECKDGFMFLNNSLNETNCYEISQYYYYFNEYNKYVCTEEKECPLNFNKLIKDKNKCINDCTKDDVYKYEYNYICYDHCPNGTNNSNYICHNIINENFLPYQTQITTSISLLSSAFLKYEDDKNNISNIILVHNETSNIHISNLLIDYEKEEDKKINNFRVNIFNDNIIKDLIDNKKDYIQQDDNVTYQIATSDNQKNNTHNNISSINLGVCENILKDKYNINKNLPLIIFKIDYYSPDTLIPIVGYEVYHPINKSRLDLIYCKDILIKLNIPTSIDENNLFKYDPNSGFYNDNCFSFTTEDGTDIILSDRKKEFNDNNLSLCQNHCEYIEYNKDSKQSSCECGIKNKMDSISEIIDNPNKLSNTFDTNETDSNFGSSNIITMKCTKALFSKDGLINNISSYILFIFIFIFLL